MPPGQTKQDSTPCRCMTTSKEVTQHSAAALKPGKPRNIPSHCKRRGKLSPGTCKEETTPDQYYSCRIRFALWYEHKTCVFLQHEAIWFYASISSLGTKLKQQIYPRSLVLCCMGVHAPQIPSMHRNPVKYMINTLPPPIHNLSLLPSIPCLQQVPELKESNQIHLGLEAKIAV